MSVIVAIVIKSACLLGLAGIAAWLLRRRSASLQAALLTAGLAAVLALPAAAAWVPAWTVPVPDLLSRDAGTVGPAAAPNLDAARPVGLAPAAALPAMSVARASRTTADISSPVVRGDGDEPSRAALLLAFWAIVTAILLARVAANHLALRRLLRGAPRVDDPTWLALVDATARDLGVRRSVDVRSSSAIGVPVVAGLRRPTLLLPDQAGEWPASFRADVIRHELSHVVRRDALGQLAGQVACACYWFNPLVWRLAHRAAVLRERACDDAVLRAGSRASDYAAQLLDLARAGHAAGVGRAALAMARPSGLADRITNLLHPSRRRAPLGARSRAIVAAGAIAAVVGLGAATPGARAVTLSARDAVAPVPAPVQGTGQAATSLCSGDLRNSSSSINDDGGRRRWRVRMQGAACDIDLRAEGEIEFNDDFTDVARIGRNGFLTIDVTSDGVRRELDLRASSSGLTRTFRVDGRERAWDEDARRWFAAFLIALDRRTAIGINQRFPMLMRQGVSAVLAEAALMTGDYARYTYHARLLDEVTLTAVDRRRVLEQAARMGRSDFYGSELLKKVVAQGRLDDAEERATVVAMIGTFDSDFYRSEAIGVLAPGPLTEAQTTTLLRVVAGMRSDFYRSETLKKVLPAGRLSPTQRSLAVDVLTDIDSDYYVTETLRYLADRDVLRHDDVLAALAKVRSDFYRGEVLATLLDRRDLDEAALLSAVSSIDGMRSDHYKAEALRRVLASRGVTDRVRAEVDRVAADLSSTYRRRIR